jgi:conjugative transfer signal peptidase TraF
LKKRIIISCALVGLLCLVLSAVILPTGLRINTSKSIPVGLYITSSASVEKGSYVLVCPPQFGVFDEAKKRGYIGAGFCPGGYGYVMKRVLAAKDDTVTVADDGVRVNGDLLPLSAPIRTDKVGRPLPRYRVGAYVLGDDELLLMSDASATSFDGRYFGPIKRSQIEAVIRPIFTFSRP